MPFVYMRFRYDGGWTCDFFNGATLQPLRRQIRFESDDKLRETAKRGGGLKNLEAKNMFEYAIQSGGGAVVLQLDEVQYENLIGKNPRRAIHA